LLNIFRIEIAGFYKPDISSNQFIRYCEKIEKVLQDNNQCKEAFFKTTIILEKVVDEKHSGIYDRSVAKTVAFSKNVQNYLRS
jgi:hypothetical protein